MSLTIDQKRDVIETFQISLKSFAELEALDLLEKGKAELSIEQYYNTYVEEDLYRVKYTFSGDETLSEFNCNSFTTNNEALYYLMLTNNEIAFRKMQQ